MKKFYQTVSVKDCGAGTYSLLLDQKPVQTPLRQTLVLSSLPLARAVVQEWEGQEDVVRPDTMPLTQLAMTLQDRVIPNRPQFEQEILGFLDTDLVCYRAEGPEIYKAAQEAAWDPFVGWASDKFATMVQVTDGLSPLAQSPELHTKIAAFIRDASDAEFMGLYLATTGAGSLLVALGFVGGDFTVDDVVNAAFVEEKLKDKIYLSETYGSAPDQERRIKALTADMNAVKSFLSFL